MRFDLWFGHPGSVMFPVFGALHHAEYTIYLPSLWKAWLNHPPDKCCHLSFGHPCYPIGTAHITALPSPLFSGCLMLTLHNSNFLWAAGLIYRGIFS